MKPKDLFLTRIIIYINHNFFKFKIIMISLEDSDVKSVAYVKY